MKHLFYLSCCTALCISVFSQKAQANDPAETLLFDNTPLVETTNNSKAPDGSSFLNKLKLLLNLDNKEKINNDSDETPETEEEKKIRLAQNGDVEAQLFLAYSYLYGTNNFPNNQQKALKYYTMAAMQGNATAINNLGSLLFSGSAGTKDIPLSIELFEAASEKGDDSATINLAFLYLTGQHLAKDVDKALSYMRKSADFGNPLAQYMLGMAYLKGIGLPQNDNLAFSLIQASANAGYDVAQLQAAQMLFNGTGTTQNYVSSKHNLIASSRQGNVDAMTLLADLSAAGTAFEKDPIGAHAWYNIASVNGRPDAGEKREEVAKILKKEDILIAQDYAAKFVAQPTKVSQHTLSTFGEDLDLLLTTP